MPRTFRTRGLSRLPRRKLVWGRSIRITPLVIGIGTTAAVNLLGDLETQMGAELIGCTVMRIRGVVSFHIDFANGDQQSQTAWAITVANPETTTGIDPLGVTSKYNDWMGYGSAPNWAHPGPPQVSPGEFRANREFMVDVKAKRKFDELNEELVMALTAQGDAGPVVSTSHNLSILVALP